jgi:hypothetical protein
MQDAADDVEADSRAEVIRALIASTGCTPEQALDRIERLERVAAILSDSNDPDNWDVEYD